VRSPASQLHQFRGRSRCPPKRELHGRSTWPSCASRRRWPASSCSSSGANRACSARTTPKDATHWSTRSMARDVGSYCLRRGGGAQDAPPRPSRRVPTGPDPGTPVR
jgi:hypothetical protein